MRDGIEAAVFIVGGLVFFFGTLALVHSYLPQKQTINETCVRGHVYLYVRESDKAHPYVVPALDDDGKPLQCGGAL